MHGETDPAPEPDGRGPNPCSTHSHNAAVPCSLSLYAVVRADEAAAAGAIALTRPAAMRVAGIVQVRRGSLCPLGSAGPRSPAAASY